MTVTERNAADGPPWDRRMAQVLVRRLVQFSAERRTGTPPNPYPRWGPFELEDGTYPIGPIVWLGGLYWFFLPACVGTIVACAAGSYYLIRQARRPIRGS